MHFQTSFPACTEEVAEINTIKDMFIFKKKCIPKYKIHQSLKLYHHHDGFTANHALRRLLDVYTFLVPVNQRATSWQSSAM